MGKLDKTMNTNIHSSQPGRVRTDRHTTQVLPDQAGGRARVYLRTDKDGGEGRIARMAAGLPALVTSSKSRGKNSTVSSVFSSTVARTWLCDVSMYFTDPHEAGSFLSCPRFKTRSWAHVMRME